MLSLIVGIVSSLFATAIFIVISELVRRVILPWYTDKIYRGVRIDGRWELDQFEGIENKDSKIGMYLDITQKGDMISGTYSHKDKDETIDVYELSGRIRDRYLFAMAVPISNRQLDGVTFLLYMHNKQSNLLLSGKALCCNDPGSVGAVDDLVFSWKKP